MEINIKQHTPMLGNSQPQPRLQKGPRTPKSSSGQKYLDLGYIGQQIAGFINQTKHLNVMPADIRILYLSTNADAVCFCQKEYMNYDISKKQPYNTPLYFYSGLEKKVVLMGNTLGGTEAAVNAINKVLNQYHTQLVKARDLIK